MQFSYAQANVLLITLFVGNGLNLVGSLFTVMTFIIFKAARNNGTSLIFFLALSDLCSAIANSFVWGFVINQQLNIYCKIQGALIVFGLCASMLWALMIGVYLYVVS
jgi:hypothetical protein